jgi:hypothetical protein
MQTRFNFDRTGANFAIAVLAPGFLMIALAIIGTNSIPSVILAMIIGFAALAVLWLAFTRGTYVLIDPENNLYRTSGFFFSKTVPLSDIASLRIQGAFAGLMTEVHLMCRDKDRRLKTLTTMNVQSFKKHDFKVYLETLHSANPNIAIPQELFAQSP